MSFSRADDPILIDENALDQECYDQPRRVRSAGERFADKTHEAKRAKGRFKLTEAQLKLEIRKSPRRFGFLGKPTVDEVAAAVITDDRYQKAQEEMFTAEHEMDDAESEKIAFVQRKSMLEIARDLHLTNYRSEPKFSKNGQARENYQQHKEVETYGATTIKRRITK